jgi:hypothetical protein
LPCASVVPPSAAKAMVAVAASNSFFTSSSLGFCWKEG